MNSTAAAYRAFRAEMMSAPSQDDDQFGDFESRRLRYAILWSFFENTAYDNIHSWAVGYKTQNGLYKYTRDIYSPAQRIASFARDHIWGGSLDRDAGPEGCLPIETDNERLRPAIAQLWTWSNWSIAKDIVTLQGAVMGDAILRVVDDVDKVYLEQIHPGAISRLETDAFGNIKGYCIEERRLHPETDKLVDYRETAERGEGEEVIFKTYAGKSLYAWNGYAAEWSEPYGFIPMVHIKHNNVGLDWGQSEYHGAYSKINEANDQGSMLSDQIRKTINPKWLFSGVKAGTTGSGTPRVSTTPTVTHPQPGREQSDALYSDNPDAKAQALVAPLDIEGALANISKIIEAIEAEYPELKFDDLRTRGELSGVALRIARQPIETKVNQRRGNYDNALARAQQMAVAIGGFRGLFPGFGLDSFARGELDHSIGSRPVFSVDPLQELEESRAFWEAAGLATTAGARLDSFLRDMGWSEERIAKFGIVQSEV
jgi:hypothetical protein